MNSNKINIQQFFYKFFVSLTILFFVLTLYFSFSNTVEAIGMGRRIKVYLVGTILLSILSVNLLNKLSKKVFLILIISLSFFIRLWWIININTPIESDFYLMYEGAVNAAKGNFAFAESQYFLTWVYQLGFTMYQALIVKIFGEGTFALKLLNIIYCTGITVFIYKISSRIFNEASGRVAAFMFSIYIPNILMCSVLTNQHLATFLFYFAFWLLITNGVNGKYYWLIIGIVISFANIIRPLGSFVLLAVGIYLFVSEFLNSEKNYRFKVTTKFLGIILAYTITGSLVSYSFISSGITQYPLSNRDSLWKFVLGFNHETKGSYSNSDADFISSLSLGEERKEQEIKLIKERTSDVNKMVLLFKDKFKIMWGGNDASFIWSLDKVSIPRLRGVLYGLEKLHYIAIIFSGFLGALFLMREKSINKYLVPFMLLVLGYAAVHLLIEIQTRYRYFIIPSFIIISSYGLSQCNHWISKKLKI